MFRAIAGYLHLKENPNGFEAVRAILGNRDDSVIRKNYAFLAERSLIANAQAAIGKTRARLLPRRRTREGRVMRPQIDPARRCLRVSDWPDADRAAWDAALSTDDPLSFERSTAASWKPATCHKNRRGYGRWLTFLRDSGEDLSVPLADRVARERVAAYLAELRRQEVAPYTLFNRIRELYAVMTALAPDRNWSWLRACVVHLDRHAQDVADRSLPPLLASDVLLRSMKELRCREQAFASWRDAVSYRNWLMVMTLTVLPIKAPQLRGALAQTHGAAAGILVGRYRRQRDQNRPASRRAHFRPTREGSSTITCRRYARTLRKEKAAMACGSPDGVSACRAHDLPGYYQLTKRAFGTSLNPHLFRRIFATSVSIADPEAMKAPGRPRPRTRLTTQQHYNRASAFTAARKHAEIMQRLRARTSRLG